MAVWLILINKTIKQQNRIKSLKHSGNPLEQKQSSLNILGCLHLPTSLKNISEKSVTIASDFSRYLSRQFETMKQTDFYTVGHKKTCP